MAAINESDVLIFGSQEGFVFSTETKKFKQELQISTSLKAAQVRSLSFICNQHYVTRSGVVEAIAMSPNSYLHVIEICPKSANYRRNTGVTSLENYGGERPINER